MFVQSWDDFEKCVTLYVEADQNVAYAYLFINRAFRSMVWLYNISDTPDIPDWVTGENIRSPCKNSSEYTSSQLLFPNNPPYDLLVTTNLSTQSVCQVELGIVLPNQGKKQLLAILREDQNCGWCSNATKDSPVAKSISSAIASGVTLSNCWEDTPKGYMNYRVLDMTK